MKKFIFVFTFILISAIAAKANAFELNMPPIHVCPAWGCGGPVPIHPIVFEQAVPSGYYFAKTPGGSIGLVVSGNAGATLYEGFANDPSEQDIGRFPELFMHNAQGEFSATGTMAPSCDADRACPEFIELISIHGEYHPATHGGAASIDLTFGGGIQASGGASPATGPNYHLVQQVLHVCPAWGCGPAPVRPIEFR